MTFIPLWSGVLVELLDPEPPKSALQVVQRQTAVRRARILAIGPEVREPLTVGQVVWVNRLVGTGVAGQWLIPEKGVLATE